MGIAANKEGGTAQSVDIRQGIGVIGVVAIILALGGALAMNQDTLAIMMRS